MENYQCSSYIADRRGNQDQIDDVRKDHPYFSKSRQWTSGLR